MLEKDYKYYKIKNKECKIIILKGGYNHEDPASYMDNIVKEFTKDKDYHEFVETNLDLPWIRVLIFGLNDIKFKS